MTVERKDNLMEGRRGLVLGVANDHSIAWGIANRLAASGAELASTYQDDAFRKRVEPLARSVDSPIVMPCDVDSDTDKTALFDRIAEVWGRLDFLVHAVAYSSKAELRGRYIHTSRANFRHSLMISCFSFTDMARRALPLMSEGGSLVTLTYLGSERVMPSYNVMGVAKAALETSVRYLAVDLGREGVRVNAISAGPMRTLAGSAIGDARYVWRHYRDNSPLRRPVHMDEVAGAGLYLLSDLSRGVTGEVLHVDSGFHVVGIPAPGTADARNGGEPGNGTAAATSDPG